MVEKVIWIVFNNYVVYWSKIKVKVKLVFFIILLERFYDNYVIILKLWVGGVKNDISDNVRDVGV